MKEEFEDTKEQSQSVNRRTDTTMDKRRTDNTMDKRRTDNTMVKGKIKNRRTNNDLQNITHKLEIEKHAPH